MDPAYPYIPAKGYLHCSQVLTVMNKAQLAQMCMFLWRYIFKYGLLVKRITELIYWMCSLVCKKLPPSRVSLLLFSPAKREFLLLHALINISHCQCSIPGHSSRDIKFTIGISFAVLW